MMSPRAVPFFVDSPLSTPTSSPSSNKQLPVLLDDQTGLAALLRQATARAHQEVMQPAIVAKLVSGQLPREIHLRYLMMLYQIYTALEDALSLHSTHPLLAGIYQPALLARATALDADCAYYTGEVEWRRTSKIWRELEDQTPEGLDAYVGRLEELARNYDESKSATLLVAHAYVRYLGDLSGGQTIARTIRRTYSLPSTGEGSSFYEFYLPSSTLGLPTPAGPKETQEIKAWFRKGLDEAGENMSEGEIAAVVKEARYAFELNIEVFKSFEGVMKKWVEEHGAESMEGVAANKAKAKKVAGKKIAIGKKKERMSVMWGYEDTNVLAVAGVGVAVVLALYVAFKDSGVLVF